MKTLKLTHEELSLLLRALGIAEQQAAEIRKNKRNGIAWNIERKKAQARTKYVLFLKNGA